MTNSLDLDLEKFRSPGDVAVANSLNLDRGKSSRPGDVEIV